MFIKRNEVKKIEKEVKEKSFMFDQWAQKNREDYGSESNPSEDELNPIERKAKVLSEVKTLKPVKKRKKSPKKKKHASSQKNNK